MINQNQAKLEKEVNILVSKYGVGKAVEIVKSKPARGIYSEMQNYPSGVFISCDSEKGGVLVGEKSC